MIVRDQGAQQGARAKAASQALSAFSSSAFATIIVQEMDERGSTRGLDLEIINIVSSYHSEAATARAEQPRGSDGTGGPGGRSGRDGPEGRDRPSGHAEDDRDDGEDG